jgi:hypothetical protein
MISNQSWLYRDPTFDPSTALLGPIGHKAVHASPTIEKSVEKVY